uniref:Uncharacterized protein n=1 Tax=Strigamia maritima TaxID=126957 RepID=T1J9K0_STRMM
GIRTVVQLSDKSDIPSPSSCTEKHLNEFLVNYSKHAPIGMYCETFDKFASYVNEGKAKQNGNEYEEFMMVAKVGQYARLAVESLKRLDKWKINGDYASRSIEKSDGVIHQRNRRGYLLHLVIKPGFEEGVPQALLYYYLYTCEKIKTAKDPKITDCCRPAIIFFFDGYVLFLYGAVITHQVSVQPLIRPIDLMADDARSELSAILYALDKSLGELDNYYDKARGRGDELEQIVHFPIIRYENLNVEKYKFNSENMKNIELAEQYMKIWYEDEYEDVVRNVFPILDGLRFHE